jgi:transmembrane sensor
MSERLRYLFARHLAKTLTVEEQKELLGLSLEPAQQEELKQLMEEAWSQTGTGEDIEDEKAYAMLEKILAERKQEAAVIRMPGNSRRRWWMVAAAVVFVIGFGVYLLWLDKETISTKEQRTSVRNVEAPKSTRAMIVLSDGLKIELDSMNAGTILAEGGIHVTKNERGEIVYLNNNAGQNQLTYNTLVNPRGSKVASLVLVDGTKVWLNSESSIRYYTSIGRERLVEITGEAYFEVAKDPSHRFTVVTDRVSTIVLGTHFNINSYKEEKNTSVTLLEGSVRLEKNKEAGMLKPGQQAQISNSIKILDKVDIDAVMAWKNGLFHFVNADFNTVMTQIGRWYDLDIVYESKIPSRRFEGKIQRDLNLSDVLDGLANNQIDYRIEGRKLIIE